MPQMTLEFLFLTGLFVALYWSLPERLRPWSLLVASSAFLLAWDPGSFALLAALTGGVHAAERYAPPGSRRAFRGVLLAILVVFAGVKTWDVLGDAQVLPALAIPLGFGFYLLKLLHYWIERDLGTLPQHGPLTLANYMLFFPTLLVGPIHRFEPFARCERRMRWDPTLFAEGLRHVLYGYAKVIVLGNWLVAHQLWSWLQASAAPDSRAMVLGEALVHGLYVYFSFAGFSDVAVGLGRLLGQRIAPNFCHPFLRRNLSEFWRNWHMSLSDWCRQYVFTPVLVHWRRPALAMVASMLAIGLWHEFTPRYVAWGLYHGLGLTLFRGWERHVAPRLPRWEHPVARHAGQAAATACTFGFVIVGFTITKNDTLAQTAADFRRLLVG